MIKMIYLQRSKRKRKKNYSIWLWLGIVIAFLLVVFLGKAGWRAWEKEKQLGQVLEALKSQREELEAEKEELEKAIAAVDQPDYLEEVGREELNLRKPGEKVVALVQSSSESEKEKEPSLHWWEKVGALFKEWFAFRR